MDSGTALRQEINSRLESYPYPPDMGAVAHELEEIRTLFTDEKTTSFTADQRAAVLTLLQAPEFGFDPERRLRFRSQCR